MTPEIFEDTPELVLQLSTIALIGCERRIVEQAKRLPRICGERSSSITTDLAIMAFYKRNLIKTKK